MDNWHLAHMPICSVGTWPRPFPYRTALKSPYTVNIRFVGLFFKLFLFLYIYHVHLVSEHWYIYSEFHSQQLGSVMLTSDYTFLPLEGEYSLPPGLVLKYSQNFSHSLYLSHTDPEYALLLLQCF